MLLESQFFDLSNSKFYKNLKEKISNYDDFLKYLCDLFFEKGVVFHSGGINLLIQNKVIKSKEDFINTFISSFHQFMDANKIDFSSLEDLTEEDFKYIVSSLLFSYSFFLFVFPNLQLTSEKENSNNLEYPFKNMLKIQ